MGMNVNVPVLDQRAKIIQIYIVFGSVGHDLLCVVFESNPYDILDKERTRRRTLKRSELVLYLI